MVSQNDDDGAQDPQYPWARNVLSTSADIRYCEADGTDDCDTHNSEIMRWLTLPQSDTQSVSITGASTINLSYESEPFSYTIEEQFSDSFIVTDNT